MSVHARKNMQRFVELLLLFCWLCFGASNIVHAGSMQDGFAAGERGDYARALEILRPLAEQGLAPRKIILESCTATDGVLGEMIKRQ
jgi:hypothetical protein